MPTTLFSSAAFVLLFFAAGLCQANTYSQTQSGALSFPSIDPITLIFTGTPMPVSAGTLTLVALSGELDDGFNKRLENLNIEGDVFTTAVTPALPSGYVLPTTQTQDSYLGVGGGFPDPVTIPLVDLSGYAADGQVEISITRPSFIGGGAFEFTLEYATIPEPSTLALLAAMCPFALRRR